MRIVIDLQGAQCKSRHRGIGRYSLALAHAMIRNNVRHEFIVALSDLFPETIEPIRASLDGLLPQENIRVWSAPGPVHALENSHNWRRHTAELVREYFLASLKPDILHITSLFEGFDENAVHSIGLAKAVLPTAVTFYDLIPLIQEEVYLKPSPIFEAAYREKLQHLRRASLFLAISESSRLEAIQHLDIAPEQAINISSAADDHFKPLRLSNTIRQAVLDRFRLTHPFLMYSGATDDRKNHLRLITAFSLLHPSLRRKHQLAIVGRLPDVDREKFVAHARSCGLNSDDVIITGQVSDDDLVCLYNLCDLFVFPSFHEGFGLPALEAMSCGAPVIGANTTSVPEVIGRSDALFDPYDEQSIAGKITEALTNDLFKADLARHGLEQAKKFSWDICAQRAIGAFEQFHSRRTQQCQMPAFSGKRPRLAYISPLPPERSGIADYSAELLPELSRYYDIDAIVAQDHSTNAWINENCSIRDVDWFVQYSGCYDRVLYHFGNSHFHQHMFALLDAIPGIVVLHDFFLSGIVAHMDQMEVSKNGWLRELYYSHGYKAVQERSHSTDWKYEIFKYPVNRSVLEGAHGVIVHSENSRRLAELWVGKTFAQDLTVIPHLRVPATLDGRSDARQALGIRAETLVVCSFGMLAATKQSRRLLDAWMASSLHQDHHCILVFVGENDPGAYGEAMTAAIDNSGITGRIIITGWTETERFRQYLTAADIGVQLRTLSRGETSGTVLDCMNYALPTIVNANGSMADLPADAVWMLPDEFDDSELIYALDTLRSDAEKRQALGAKAREVILTRHAPQACARRYAQDIEFHYQQPRKYTPALASAIARIESPPSGELEWMALAESIATNQPPPSTKQFLVDVSALVCLDLKSGVERVVRSVLSELIDHPPPGFRVEPVYANAGERGYRYARRFTLEFLKCSEQILEDECIEAFPGDVFLGLDLHQHIVHKQADFYSQLQRRGIQVYFVVYDLLPVLRPEVFPESSFRVHDEWLRTVQQASGVVCISRAVADELIDWLASYGTKRLRPLAIGWFHLGADVARSAPSRGLPTNAGEVLAAVSRRPSFLMVGTVEPRKGYLQVLSAFDQLWATGMDVNLVIVGNEGWKGLPDEQRRTIPLMVRKLRNHSEANRRLFWLEGISDEYLEGLYVAASCLIAASEAEGFGLPLIEAAQHKKPIICRDIPVFREVAGDNALYFSGLTPDALSASVRNWLALDKSGQVPKSVNLPWQTWKQSTENLLDVILSGQWYQQWMMPRDVRRFWADDPHIETAVGQRSGHDMWSTGRAGHLLYGPYVPLQAGSYRIVVRGSLGSAGFAGAKMDVAVERGQRILSELILEGPVGNDCLAALTITLEAPCSDLEARIWVSDKSDFCVSMIEIAPWQG